MSTTALTLNQHKGFSLVEIAIVMVIIGVIMAAVSIGKNTKDTADATQLFKKRVESCVAVSYGGQLVTPDSQLSSFCEVTGKTARIKGPDAKDTEAMRNKAFEKLSPDDFIVSPYEKNSKFFEVITN
jgi:prepilin-type N-terminal cleavage/methylation domain-containing protein